MGGTIKSNRRHALNTQLVHPHHLLRHQVVLTLDQMAPITRFGCVPSQWRQAPSFELHTPHAVFVLCHWIKSYVKGAQADNAFAWVVVIVDHHGGAGAVRHWLGAQGNINVTVQTGERLAAELARLLLRSDEYDASQAVTVRLSLNHDSQASLRRYSFAPPLTALDTHLRRIPMVTYCRSTWASKLTAPSTSRCLHRSSYVHGACGGAGHSHRAGQTTFLFRDDFCVPNNRERYTLRPDTVIGMSHEGWWDRDL